MTTHDDGQNLVLFYCIKQLQREHMSCGILASCRFPPVPIPNIVDGEIEIEKGSCTFRREPFTIAKSKMAGEVHVDWWTETPDRSKVSEKARNTPIPFPIRIRSLQSSPGGGKNQDSDIKIRKGLSDITNSPTKPTTTPARTLEWAMSLLSEKGESCSSTTTAEEEEQNEEKEVCMPSKEEKEGTAPVGATTPVQSVAADGSRSCPSSGSSSSASVLRL